MPATALYVEDEDFDIAFMRMAFQKAGLGSNLQVVTSGQEAVDYLAGKGNYGQRQQYPLPSVVLLDLNLPIISGFQVLQWLREQQHLRGLPVVIFSSSRRAEDQELAMKLGATDYLQKPDSGMDFATVVQKLKDPFLKPAQESC